jgi:hypothetical protein
METPAGHQHALDQASQVMEDIARMNAQPGGVDPAQLAQKYDQLEQLSTELSPQEFAIMRDQAIKQVSAQCEAFNQSPFSKGHQFDLSQVQI